MNKVKKWKRGAWIPETDNQDHKDRKTSVKNKTGSLVMGREAESIEEVMLKNTTNVGTE